MIPASAADDALSADGFRCHDFLGTCLLVLHCVLAIREKAVLPRAQKGKLERVVDPRFDIFIPMYQCNMLSQWLWLAG